MLNRAINPLKETNTALQAEINSLREQLETGTNPAPSAQQFKANVLREERDAAKKRARERLAERNIEVGEEDFSPQSSRNERIKTSNLDEFDGSDVSSFMLSIQAARAMFPSEAVASVIARNLRGMAKHWFQNLSSSSREMLLLSLEDFARSIRHEFEVDKSIARQSARDRKWIYQKESVLTYFYDKINLLINSFGEKMDQVDQCHEIREGLPDDFKPFVRTLLGGKPNLDQLRKELKLLELDYLNSKKKRPVPVQSPMPIFPGQQIANIPRNVKQESPSTSKQNGARRIPLKESFNPKMIGQSPNPSNPSQMIRTYTVPDGSGRVLMLNRPCRTCGGNHFDFEPVHAHTSSLPDSSSDFDSYPIFTPIQHNSGLSIGYPAFVPQSFDPRVQTNQSAYPSYIPSSLSNEEYAYQMMRIDPPYKTFSPDSTDSFRFQEEDSSASSDPPSSPQMSKN